MISFYIYNIYIRVSTVTTYSIVNVVSVDGVIRRISNLNKDEKKKNLTSHGNILTLDASKKYWRRSGVYVVNLEFGVNNTDSKTTSMMSFWYLYC